MNRLENQESGEIRIQNIRSELETLMVTLVLPTEPVFADDRDAEFGVKLEQIRHQITQLKDLDSTGYVRIALEALAKMCPTMHKVAILECSKIINEVLLEDGNYV